MSQQKNNTKYHSIIPFFDFRSLSYTLPLKTVLGKPIDLVQEFPANTKCEKIKFPSLFWTGIDYQHDFKWKDANGFIFYVKHHPAGYTKDQRTMGDGTQEDPWLDIHYAAEVISCMSEKLCGYVINLCIEPDSVFDKDMKINFAGQRYYQTPVILGYLDGKTFVNLKVKLETNAYVVSQFEGNYDEVKGEYINGEIVSTADTTPDYSVLFKRSQTDSTPVEFSTFIGKTILKTDDFSVEITGGSWTNNKYTFIGYKYDTPTEIVNETREVFAAGFIKADIVDGVIGGTEFDFLWFEDSYIHGTAVTLLENGNINIDWDNGENTLFEKKSNTQYVFNRIFYAPNCRKYKELILTISTAGVIRFEITGVYDKITKEQKKTPVYWDAVEKDGYIATGTCLSGIPEFRNRSGEIYYYENEAKKVLGIFQPYLKCHYAPVSLGYNLKNIKFPQNNAVNSTFKYGQTGYYVYYGCKLYNTHVEGGTFDNCAEVLFDGDGWFRPDVISRTKVEAKQAITVASHNVYDSTEIYRGGYNTYGPDSSVLKSLVRSQIYNHNGGWYFGNIVLLDDVYFEFDFGRTHSTFCLDSLVTAIINNVTINAKAEAILVDDSFPPHEWVLTYLRVDESAYKKIAIKNLQTHLDFTIYMEWEPDSCRSIKTRLAGYAGWHAGLKTLWQSGDCD